VSAASKTLIAKLDKALSDAQFACSNMVTVEARESSDAGDRAAHKLGTDVWSELEQIRRRLRLKGGG
jgi:hypothetical protein